MLYLEIASRASQLLILILSINAIRMLLVRKYPDLIDFIDLPYTGPYAVWFLTLALFKGIKIVVHIFSYYCLTRRVHMPASSKYSSSDVTVIVPTIGDFGEEFHACIRSILACRPAEVIVSVVGNPDYARSVCRNINRDVIRVVAVKNANKRNQFLAAAKTVKTAILVNADDHVFWPTTFLQSALIPFDDPLVGLVGTVKRVIRERGNSLKESFLNYIACMYLERHNFECTATYNLDGGVFVISGRTQLVRTEIVMREDYKFGYLNGK
jgi:cellulose synthase/poly-beta-1,6-N-acetylglucosamine synthase-like glycosyltransferase